MEAFYVAAAIIAALLFYWIRCQTRFWYGVIEIGVAVLGYLSDLLSSNELFASR